ncbi:alginate O-acetyltransferase AlgX-related protein [Pelagicoccus mobilis]|uniref:AlgX/AlgJ SGNH hydrolase-like domain-containing protein n=1 Tax=Pelagicoccus mobilis TaxID=415221 RepID=A0A934VN35_9BACT|nr:hypothetical protein [Pelagicoccus mobilis]MBK1879501.1 hypothetical protein [Pelagicoccus mobilis]
MKYYQYIVSAFFFLCIVLPLVLVGNNERSLITNKKLNRFPNLEENDTLGQSVEKIEAYFDDQYGLKEVVQREAGHFLYSIGSSSNKVVTVGEDGWLFYTSKNDGNPFKDIVRTEYYTEEQKQNWAEHINEKVSYFSEIGVEYYFIVAPNKSSIYREFIPDRLKPNNSKSRCEDLFDHFRNNGIERALFLLDSLTHVNMRESRNLYSKFGSHWNHLGTAYAHEAISSGFRLPKFERVDTDSIVQKIELKDGVADMDLAKLLTMHKSMNDTDFALVSDELYKNKVYLDRKKYGLDNGRPFYSLESNSIEEGTLLFVGDSFGEHLAPYFCRNFKTVIVVWYRPNRKMFYELVNDFNPDYIIEQRVERYMSAVPPPRFE